MNLTIADKIALNNGVEIPLLGLGTFQLKKRNQARKAVRFALERGYRLIDTAAAYGNEQDVGAAIAESQVPREEIFVTTKVWGVHEPGYDRTLAACRESLDKLNLEVVDLYLVHWPPEKSLRAETWNAMIALQEEGLCRAIGVSNYTITHLDELLAETSVIPAVNQVEFHPFNFPEGLLAYCRDRGIQLQSYTPLTRGMRLRDKTITSVAARYGKKPAQVMLRWVLQHDVGVVPKSANKQRIDENATVFDFEIDDADMTLLDALNEDFRVGWHPPDWP